MLTVAEASELLTVSIPVMERMRKAGTGPRFIRLSTRRVGYRASDLREWIARQTQGGSAQAA